MASRFGTAKVVTIMHLCNLCESVHNSWSTYSVSQLGSTDSAIYLNWYQMQTEGWNPV